MKFLYNLIKVTLEVRTELFMSKKAEHIIKSIKANSIAEEMELEIGDKVLEINSKVVEDIFDYQYLVQDEYIEVLIEKPDGEQFVLEIEKDYDEDLGVEFENGLMDDYKSCTNNCIFCFIHQLPKGMRETLYFKDDDSRLSFLQGNYVTLTNMSEHDINRIIEYNLSPINVSFHTTNPELRVRMLKNKFAGEALKKVDRLIEGGIIMNGQIVLCKGFNDGAELERTITDLMKYLPNIESVSIVPVGLSKYRCGLEPLELFTKEDAIEVLDMIHKYQEISYKQYGIHFIHASDEWYILAERDLPLADNYDGYIQYENGVGMLRLLLDEVDDAISILQANNFTYDKTEKLTMATGKLAAPFIQAIADKVMALYDGLEIEVVAIINNFFGENITVSGLLTGIDIKTQLLGKELGRRVILPENVLRSGEDIFLDDMTLTQLQNSLQVQIDIVKSSGYDLVGNLLQTSIKPIIKE